MKLIMVTLILAVAGLEQTFGTNERPALYFNWRNALPWTKGMPKEEYLQNIDLHLIKKEWRPNGANVPDGDNIVPKYLGTVDEAVVMFQEDSTMYDSHLKPLGRAVELLSDEYGYNKTQESIFVIHTISGDAHNYFVKNMMIAFALRNFMKHYNVFAFNMPALQESLEQTVVRSAIGGRGNYKDLSETMGIFFESAFQKKLMTAGQIHLFGFCYSSQLAGYIGRLITSKTGQKIKSIAALDPYSLGLSSIVTTVLSKKDAQVVHVYHTNSVALGTLHREGTVDFSFNTGYWQPGCISGGKAGDRMMCSHRRAVTAFWYVILYPDLWVARKCFSWILFKLCLCNRMATAPLSYPPAPGPKGKYYLNTLGHKPYGLGEQGSLCYPKTPKIEKEEKISKDYSVSEKF